MKNTQTIGCISFQQTITKYGYWRPDCNSAVGAGDCEGRG